MDTEALLKFFKNTFNINVMILFLIASIFLIWVDAKQYKKDGMKRESRFSKFMGYFYIVLGIGLYLFAKFINI